MDLKGDGKISDLAFSDRKLTRKNVTLHAAVGGDVPIALNHVEMALPAGDAFFNVSSMIKGIPIDVYVPLGLRVARRALSDRT